MSLISDGKEVFQLVSKLGNTDLIEKVIKVNGELLELSTQNLEFKQRINELEAQLKAANNQLNLAAQVERRGGCVYIDGDPEPHCSQCYDSDKKLIHIVQMRFERIGLNAACPRCKTICGMYPEGMAHR